MPGQAVAIGLGCAEKSQSITAITETTIFSARLKPAAAAEAVQELTRGKDARTTITYATSILDRPVAEVSIASIRRIEWSIDDITITVGHKGPNGVGTLVFGVEDSGLRQACINTLLALRSDLRPKEVARRPFEAIKGYLIALVITAVAGGVLIMMTPDGLVVIDSIQRRGSWLKQLLGLAINPLVPTGTIGLVAVLLVIEVMLLRNSAKNPGTKFVAEDHRK